MRVLLTGATGIIGRHLADELARRGHDVVVPAADGRRVDLRDPDALAAAVEQAAADALVHAAWYGGPDRIASAENGVWVEISRRLLDAFVAHGGHRVVTLGTCFEYELGSSPLVEDVTPVRPHTPYGKAKAEVSELVGALDVSGAHARIGYVYGPGEEPPRLVPALVSALAAGERFAATSGEQRRDYLYVTDVAAGISSLMESELRGPVNVGSGSAIAVADLIHALADVLGRRDLLDLGALPLRAGDPEVVELSVERLRTTGWSPEVTLVEGAERTVRGMIDGPLPLRGER